LTFRPSGRRRAQSLPKDFKQTWEIPPDDPSEYVLLRSHVFPDIIFPGLNLNYTHNPPHQIFEDPYSDESEDSEDSDEDEDHFPPTNTLFPQQLTWRDVFPELESDSGFDNTLSSPDTTHNSLSTEISDSEHADGEGEEENLFLPAAANTPYISFDNSDLESDSDSDDTICTPPSPDSTPNIPLPEISDLEDTNSVREDEGEDPFISSAAYSPYSWGDIPDFENTGSDGDEAPSSPEIRRNPLNPDIKDLQDKDSERRQDYLHLRAKYRFLSQIEEGIDPEVPYSESEAPDTTSEDSEDEDHFYLDTKYKHLLSKMDRQDRDVGIVRWSQNPSRDEFMTINLNYRIVQLYEANGHAQPGRFDYQKSSKYNDFPPLSTYDWSPNIPGLVAMGTSHGEVNLLRVDDNSHSFITLPLKSPRPCQSVAFNTTGLLAVGLDRVRNDFCLQIWDINQRLAGRDPKKPGWDLPNMTIEPKKLEASVSITSVRFFEDQPQTLVIGVKNQSVRIHDLRGVYTYYHVYSLIKVLTNSRPNFRCDHVPNPLQQ
jgi:hypothetical protein